MGYIFRRRLMSLTYFVSTLKTIIIQSLSLLPLVLGCRLKVVIHHKRVMNNSLFYFNSIWKRPWFTSKWVDSPNESFKLNSDTLFNLDSDDLPWFRKQDRDSLLNELILLMNLLSLIQTHYSILTQTICLDSESRTVRLVYLLVLIVRYIWILSLNLQAASYYKVLIDHY